MDWKINPRKSGTVIPIFASIFALGCLQQADAGSWSVTLNSTGSAVGTGSGRSSWGSNFGSPAPVTGTGSASIQYPFPRTDTTGMSSADFGSCQENETLTVTPTLQWVPASGQTMVTDPPPAQISVAESSYSCASVTGSALSVHAAVNDGLGDTPTTIGPNPLGSMLYGYSTTSQGTRFTIYNSSTGTVYPPTCTITNSGGGSNSIAFFGSGAAPSGTHGWIAFTVKLLGLNSPDPTGHPDLGDGKNQYVYNTTFPNGLLYVPGSIIYSGATQAEAQALVDQHIVDLKVENPVIPNVFSHTWSVTGNIISVFTSGYPTGNWVFSGLPDSNTPFGNHDVNLYVNGKIGQSARIQDFFNATASNWPGAGGYQLNHSGTVLPNWYYYYDLIFPNQPGGFRDYEHIPTSHTYPTSPTLNMIGDDAYSKFNVQLYRLPSRTGTLIEDGGTLSVNGIHNFIFTCAHERTHTQYLTSGIDIWLRPRHINLKATTIDQDPNGDWDGDGLSNSWEAAHHLDPTNSDTAGLYGGSDVGDTELCANIGGWGVLQNLKGTWIEDWSNTGLQWGNWFQHDPDVNSNATTPYLPWFYYGGQPIGPNPPSYVLSAMP